MALFATHYPVSATQLEGRFSMIEPLSVLLFVETMAALALRPKLPRVDIVVIRTASLR